MFQYYKDELNNYILMNMKNNILIEKISYRKMKFHVINVF